MSVSEARGYPQRPRRRTVLERPLKAGVGRTQHVTLLAKLAYGGHDESTRKQTLQGEKQTTG